FGRSLVAEAFDGRLAVWGDAQESSFEGRDLQRINIAADVLGVATRVGAFADDAHRGTFVNHDRVNGNQHMTARTRGELFAKAHAVTSLSFRLGGGQSIIIGCFKKV